jgi:hypothetical protein
MEKNCTVVVNILHNINNVNKLQDLKEYMEFTCTVVVNILRDNKVQRSKGIAERVAAWRVAGSVSTRMGMWGLHA